MIEISVGSVTIDAAPTVPPTADLVTVADRLRRPAVPAVLIVDDAGSLVGVLTESDVVAVVAEAGGVNVPASAYMSQPVVTTHPATPIGLAADRMRDAGVALLPVVDDDSSCEGVITRERLAPYLSRHRLAVEWGDDPLSLAASEDEEATGERAAATPES